VETIAGNDGKLQIAIERCGRYQLPHYIFVTPRAWLSIDLDHARGRASPPAMSPLPMACATRTHHSCISFLPGEGRWRRGLVSLIQIKA
jgi:hypothetical protein